MWIQLTASDGRPVSFNSNHLVLLKDHGDYTLVVHRNGAELVKESQGAIFDSLRLEGTERSQRATQSFSRGLHS